MPDPAAYVQVLTTVGSEEEAERIGGELLDARLVACVQVFGPISSRYVWRGRIEQQREWACLAKTEASRYDDVEAAIRSAHPYEEPEIVATPIVAGSPGYLGWISRSLEERTGDA